MDRIASRNNGWWERGVRRRIAACFAALSSRPVLASGIGAWVLAALALVLRLPFGAATTDETFYSAMPYGFLLGNKPYQDELAFHQNAGILLMPFFRVYMALFGSEGILLFNRWLYVAAIAVCSVLAFRLVRRLVNASAGAWVAALVVTFSYFNLFALSYNTIGALGLFGGIVLSTHALLERPVPHLVAAWLFFVAGAFSYPTFALIAVPHSALVVVRLRGRVSREEFKRCLLTVGACSLASLVLAAAFLAWVTPAGVKRAIEFSRAMGYGKNSLVGLESLLASSIWLQRYHLLAYAALLALWPLALKRFRGAAFAVGMLGPVLLLLIYSSTGEALTVTRAALFWTACPVLTPVCVALAWGYPHRRLLLEQLWAPGLLSLVIVSFTSANGSYGAPLGALPALVAGMVGLSALLSGDAATGRSTDAQAPAPDADAQPMGRRTHAAGAGEWVFAGFAAALLATQVHSMFASVYDFDPRFSSSTTRIKHGPYRGARTTEENARMLEGIDSDLKKLEDPSKTIAAFDEFNVVYLSTRMRPRVFSHWSVWVFEPEYGAKITRETYAEPANQPDFLVLVPSRLRKTDVFLRYTPNYETVIDRPELGYVIQKRVRDVVPLNAPAPRRRHRRRH